MRRFFIYFLIAAGLIALLVTLYPKNETGQLYGQVELPENVKESLIGKWEWQSSSDPYENSSHKRQAELEGHKYLSINEDGTFQEWTKEQSRTGVWLLNKKKNAVAFVFGESKNRMSKVAASMLSYEYRYQIQKLNKESLVLIIQGRHGMVQEVYKSIPKEAWDELVTITR
ncbi:MAG: hypothetical protein AAFY71_13400 [Bacteroidota bacterium]